jgi:hypothetical protein
MAEPERDDRLIDAVLKQLHGGAVPQHMRTYPLVDERGTRCRSSDTMFADQMLQRVTAHLIATDRREQWGRPRARLILHPLFEQLGGIAAKRR